MNFETLAIATAAATVILATGWLLFGRLFLKRWGITATATDLMLGRRIGATYLGLSLIFFLARSAPLSDLRTSLSIGALIVCALLATLGLYEWKARRVGHVMLVSVAVEVALAIGYAVLLFL